MDRLTEMLEKYKKEGGNVVVIDAWKEKDNDAIVKKVVEAVEKISKEDK